MSGHLVCVGGSDAGISAALRAREVSPETDVTVVVADTYPNFSICGIPYHVSGDVGGWQDLAHRTGEDLAAAGLRVRTETRAAAVDVASRRLHVRTSSGASEAVPYDSLVVGTGATSVAPPVDGLRGPDALGPADGVHLLHSMGDMFAVLDTLQDETVRSALVVGAGYIGLEMAEAFTARGLTVTQVEAQPEVLPTVDPSLGALVRRELRTHGVDVVTGTTVDTVSRTGAPQGRLEVTGHADRQPFRRHVDLVLVVVGVQPDVRLLQAAGAILGVRGAVEVDDQMRTGLPHVWAAGDCVTTAHRLLGSTWLPLGTTAHKQGRVAGENAVGGHRQFRGSLGTQVVKVFDLVAARTGLRDHEAEAAGWSPATTTTVADDHKRYYPGATPLTVAVTGDTGTGRLLGAQLIGRRTAEVAKRVDTYATALHSGLTVDEVNDLDLSYTPPLGAPWDAVQAAAQQWSAAVPLAR